MDCDKTGESQTDNGERRHRRSVHPFQATRFQIEHVAEVLGLSAIVLADDLGFPLVQHGETELTELLAHSAMWTDRCGPDVDGFIFAQVKRQYPWITRADVVSHVLDLPGMPSFCRLTAVGRSAARVVGILHAASGIERIFTAAVGKPSAVAHC